MKNKVEELINVLDPNKFECNCCKRFKDIKYNHPTIISNNPFIEINLCWRCWYSEDKKVKLKVQKLVEKEVK